MKYFTMTPSIARRLRAKIFNGMSSEIYGEELGHIGREDEFSRVRSALVHLMHNLHYEPTVDIADKIGALKAAYDTMMEHDSHLFADSKKKRLDGLIADIMRLSKEQFNESFTRDDVVKFVTLATKGRDHYEAEGYDPNGFIGEELVHFGTMITANFGAYEVTLNHDYVS
jgi:hypothetical protein